MTSNDDAVPLNTKDEKKPGHIQSNKIDYVALEDEENISMNPPKKVSLNRSNNYYTQYDDLAGVIVSCAILFLIVWIGWISYNVYQYGLTTAYCKDPVTSCDQYYYLNPKCCTKGDNTVTNTCYDSSAVDHCTGLTQTISTFIAQILLIFVVICYLWLLYQTSKKGIQIHKTDAPNKSNKIKSAFEKLIACKTQLESKRIDCRNCAYSKKETPQKTAVNFLWNSLTILSLLRIIKNSPTIFLNMYTGNDILYAVGLALIIVDIANIFQNVWGNFCCCCNPCRGKCCCNDNCCCDCCFLCINCKCCCIGHFPEHHRPYVESVGNVVNYSNYLKLAGAVSQITAIGFISSTTEYHLWLTCFNFLLGVMKIIGTIQVYWKYYYLLCFYWSRMSVNKYESYKINELLNKLLVGAYIFRIKVENKDEFIRIGDDEKIAKKVTIICDCFTLGLILNGIVIGIGTIVLFWNWTKQLNQDFNIDQGFTFNLL